MRSFKGQAALEFMMTYGWAILVVLAAIGALSYFGILNPSRFTPDTCLASSGFACPGKPVVTDTNLTISVVNGLGFAVTLDSARSTLTNINCGQIYMCVQGVPCTNETQQLVQDGGGASIFLNGCTFTGASVVKGELNIVYTNPQSSLPETLKISLTAKPK
jgi:uncharacterized protein (UPF0333 family)